MKKNYLLSCIFILFFTIHSLQAQITTVLEGIEQPTAVLLEGNDLYYGEFQGSYYKYDLTSSDAPIEILATNGIYRTVKSGNYIYISESVAGRISRIDITEANPQPVVIVDNLSFPTGVVVKDDYLYYADGSDTGSVSRINLSEANPLIEPLVSNQGQPNGIGIIGNDLYFSEWLSGNISKIDITSSAPTPTIVVGGLLNPTEIIVNGNNLLVSEFSNNKILNVNVSSSPAVVTDIVTSIISPTGLFLNGDALYISEFGANRIVKYTSPVFGVAENQVGNSKLVLSPNPSNDFVQVSGLRDASNYIIYNSIGNEVNKGTIANNQKVNVTNLQTGVYFIRFADGNAIKFVKN
jgi:hypothetical protein